jgi:histo-blood group ABO system transferase
MLVIATGKYTRFVGPLLESANEHFLPGHEKTVFCFTDGIADDPIVTVPVDHLDWPGPTLKRYHYFSDAAERLKDMDYLFYSDADMLFVDKVGDEVLGDLVATEHPGFYNKRPQDFSYERRLKSKAYMPPRVGRKYFAGGFNGGKRENFLQMSRVIRGWVDDDQRHGITAVWHDESYMNKYMFMHPPSTILSPSYCFPESWNHLPFPRKLLALDKNHAEMRS